MQRLWPGTFVEEVNLAQNISIIRKAFKDVGGQDALIETVPKGGYRFTGTVRTILPDGADGARNLGTKQPSPVNGSPRLERWSRRSLTLAVAATVTSIVIAGAIGYGRSVRLFGDKAPVSSSAENAIRSIAILPLANLSSDTSQEFFSDGLTDELITKVAKIGSLRVISRTSVIGYKHTNKKVPEIGNELHVDSVVEGTVQRVNNRVRIRVQLIRAATDQHIWAETYDRDVADILDLQNEVAQTIAREIRIRLTPAEEVSLGRAMSLKPEAYEAFLQGRYHWNRRTEADLAVAEKFFREALKLEPRYAAAYAALADCYTISGQYGSVRPDEAFPKAKEAARRALELDDSLPDAHAASALVAMLYDYDWARTESEFKRAIGLNPNYASARQWYAEYLSATGKTDLAVEQMTRALEADPASRIMNVAAGRPFYYAREYDRAIEQFRHALALDDNLFPAHAMLARALCAKGQYAEAVTEMRRASRISQGNLSLDAELAFILAKAGHPKEAEAILRSLKTDAKGQFISGYSLALVKTGLGRTEEAITLLEKAFAEHAPDIVHLSTDPRFDTLRTNQRFQKLVARIGLPS